jgi:hypothetical protein
MSQPIPGNPYDCCTGKQLPPGFYCPAVTQMSATNTICDMPMSDYCFTGDRILTDKKCLLWRKSRPIASSVVLQDYCLNHLDNEECQSWANSSDNYIAAESAVKTFCKTNPNNPFCSCINSKAFSSLGVNPACIDAKCVSSGFITGNMRTMKCPTVINCEMQNDLKNSGVSLISLGSFEQNCGNSGVGNVSGGLFSNLSFTMQILIVMLFIILILVAIVMSTVIVRKYVKSS